MSLRSRWESYPIGKALKNARCNRRAEAKLCAQTLLEPARPHGLPSDLVVSLTSYPPRFGTLHFTLRSLLNQTVAPDRIVLWIAEGDATQLPTTVKSLASDRIEIRLVPDVRSFKKLVYALPTFPSAFVATADDDTLYKPDWLEALVAGQEPEAKVITCHRAHRFPIVQEEEPIPAYRSWEWDVQDDRARHPSTDLMPTGLGGVLYPPKSLHNDVTRRDLYEELCPNADDLWFYWCARRVGTKYKKVGGVFELTYWPGTQESRLFNANTSENDHQIAKLLARYGHPVAMP